MSPGILGRLFQSTPKPHIVESPPPPRIVRGPGMECREFDEKPYFIVASVEMGNTTTKCILTGVNLETGMSYVINKTVSMSRDVRPPKAGEEIFGKKPDIRKKSFIASKSHSQWMFTLYPIIFA